MATQGCLPVNQLFSRIFIDSYSEYVETRLSWGGPMLSMKRAVLDLYSYAEIELGIAACFVSAVLINLAVTPGAYRDAAPVEATVERPWPAQSL